METKCETCLKDKYCFPHIPDSNKCDYQPKSVEVMPKINITHLPHQFRPMVDAELIKQRDADLEAHYKLVAEREAEFTEAVKKILAEWANKEAWLAAKEAKTLRANMKKEADWLENNAYELTFAEALNHHIIQLRLQAGQEAGGK